MGIQARRTNWCNQNCLVGKEEWSRQKIKIKDLETGEETELSLEDL